MEHILNFLKTEYEWIFSGIGVLVVSLLFVKNSKGQKQKVDKKAIGIQAGRDVKIKDSNNKKDV